MVHGLLVRIVAKDAAFIRGPFVSDIGEVRRHSNEFEEDALLTYELHYPIPNDAADDAERDEIARTVVILERFTNAAALKDVHNRSGPFADFSACIGDRMASGDIVSVKVEHLEEVAVPKPASKVAAEVAAERAAAEEATAVVAARSGDAGGILVFAGAVNGAAPLYLEHAREVGQRVAALGRRLIFGGGTVGIMGAVAEAAAKAGGQVVSEAEGDSAAGREQKRIMLSQASWLVVCPGGIDTFSELFEVLTLCQLNAYRCRVGLLNTENFFGPMVAVVRHLVSQRLLEAATADALIVRSSPAELFAAMETGTDVVAVGRDRKLKW